MQRCQYCGFEFPENARFCSNCGRMPAPDAALSSTPQAFAPPLPENQPGAEDEEERRHAAILPIPPLPGGSFTGGQVPQVAGAPSFSGVPGLQGTPPGMVSPMSTPSPSVPVSTPPPSPVNPAGSVPSSFAPSAPPGASPAEQPGMFEQHTPSWNNAPAQQTGTSGPQYQRPPDQDEQWKEHHRHHEHHERHTRRTASKLLAGGSAKLILVAIVTLLIVAGGSLAFALHSQSPGTAGSTPVTTSKGTPASTTTSRNASASATSTGTVAASPTAASSQASGTFNFAGAIPGPMVITSLPQCGVRGGNYFMQVKGTVGGTPFTFLIGIVSYHGPGTYTSGLTVNLIKVGSFVSMDNNGSLPVTITITNNGKAGTINSNLEGIVNPTQTQPATGHVSGSWTCV